MTREKEAIWGDLLVTYNMYLHQGSVISGDQEFAALNELTTVLPTAPALDWAAASQNCGLIKDLFGMPQLTVYNGTGHHGCL